MLVDEERKEQLKIARLIDKYHSIYDPRRLQWGGDGKLSYTCGKCGHVNVMSKRNPTRYETDRWLDKRKCTYCGAFFIRRCKEDLTKYFAKYKPRKKNCKQ